MLRFLTAVLVLATPLGCGPGRPPRTDAAGAPGRSQADLPRPSHGRKVLATVPDSATVDMLLDHNRMLVDGEIQRRDGAWRRARLWVDTGNPDLFLSERLARDLGLDLSGAPGQVVNGRLEVPPPAGLRLGDMALDLRGVKAWVVFEPTWLFSTMHNDANLPATVLRRCQVVLDYPHRKLTIARPGAISPRGVAAPALIHPQTGIVQLGAVIAGDTFSFALDSGASYSFTTTRVLKHLSHLHPEWPTTTGALGAANIWGWWPQEEAWPVMRVPEIRWGGVTLSQVGLVGLGEIFGPGFDLGAWYSEKTARPVDGFLGPNAFRRFRVEIDYPNNVVYFEQGSNDSRPDMDLVGLTLRPEADGGYSVLGVAELGGESAAPGIQRGDRLIRVDGMDTRGATMGTVVDALRGEPGDVHVLVVEHDGRRRTVKVTVHRFLPLAPRSGQGSHHRGVGDRPIPDLESDSGGVHGMQRVARGGRTRTRGRLGSRGTAPAQMPAAIAGRHRADVESCSNFLRGPRHAGAPVEPNPFTYHRPSSLLEACGLLADLGPDALLLAGGTDIVVDMRRGARRARHLVSLRDVAELRGIRRDGDAVRVGALSTPAEIGASAVLRATRPELLEAAEVFGTPLIRSRATLGGNLCTAAACGDLAPLLVALDARIVIAAKSGRRELALEHFFKDVRRTALAAGEIVVEVLVPVRKPGEGARYETFGLRTAAFITVAGVAAALRMEAGTCSAARVVLSAVAPTPLLVPAAEEALVGRAPGAAALDAAAREAKRAARPISDVRGSAQHRLELVEVMARRALCAALERSAGP